MSWKRSLVNRLGRKPGIVTTAAVYGLGGGFFSRWLYQVQGQLAGGSGGVLTVSFDVDYPEDAAALPELCDLLDDFGITAGFALVGALVERYPEQHRRLVESGHEILNHSYSHPDNEVLCPDRTWDQLSVSEQADQIARCGKVCEEVLGVRPAGFRAPHFGNVTGREFYSLIAGQGYRYSSSLLAPESETCGLPYETEHGVWEFPVSTCPRHPFAVLDSWHSQRKPRPRHAGDREFAAVCRQAVSMAARYGGYLNVYMDPRDVTGYPNIAGGLAELSPAGHGLEVITCLSYLERLSTTSAE